VICLDTTFLIDLWRGKDRSDDPTRGFMQLYGGEHFIVPAHAVGEFLEGAASVSEVRFEEAIRYLRLFQTVDVSFDTGIVYARIVADLRQRSLLAGLSKVDMWIAAVAIEHGGLLATRNGKHFRQVAGLRVVEYA